MALFGNRHKIKSGRRDDIDVSKSDTSPKTRRTLRSQIWVAVSPWRWQIAEIVLSAGILASILIILGQYNEQRQPQLVQNITLNSLVAILATLLRGTLVSVVEEVIGQLRWEWFRRTRPLKDLSSLDEATRGPWGAFKYLVKFPRPNLAAVGALTTIISMGIGALTQQAIRSVPCSQPAPGVATIPIAQTMSNTSLMSSMYSATSDEIGAFGIWTSVNVNIATFTALLSGISGQSKASTVPFTCTAGNCTFTEVDGSAYSTLAVSSRCVDVTQKIQQRDLPTNASGVEEINYYPPSGLSVTYCRGPNCRESTGSVLPNGTSITIEESGTWSTMLNSTLSRRQPDPNLPTSSYPTFVVEGLSEENAGPGFLTGFAQISLIMPRARDCQAVLGNGPEAVVDDGCSIPPLNVTFLPDGFGLTAAVCWFYPSISSLTAEVVNGELIERQVAPASPLSWTFRSTRLNSYGFQDPCYIDGQRYHVGSLPRNDSVDVSTILDLYSNENITGPTQCLYGLSTWHTRAVEQLFVYMFIEDACLPTYNFQDMFCKSWWLSGLYNANNATVDSVSILMADAAQAVSNQIRIVGESLNGTTTLARGVTTQFFVCTELTWSWLIFPVGIVGITTMLLTAMIASTFVHGGEHPTWKSGLLPLLMYGLEDDSRVGEMMTSGQLNEAAKKVSVSFRPTRKGWRLATNHPCRN